MIAYLRGKLTKKEPTIVTLEVHGVGYDVHISLHTYSSIKEKEDIQLHTYLHIREDAHVLYGFFDSMEKYMFQHLISVNGIGPSTAMVALSFLPPQELRAAIVRQDQAALQRIKGVGGKTAQRIILELQDKLRKESPENELSSPSPHQRVRTEALAALTTLGIPKPAAEKNVDTILQKDPSLSLEEVIKQALKNS